MRLAQIAIPVLVGLSLVGAFRAGRYVAAQDSVKATQAVVSDLTSANTAEALFLITGVRERLRQGQAVEADTILLRYAALKAPQLLECASQRTCTQLGAGLMPSKQQLEKFIEDEKSLRAEK